MLTIQQLREKIQLIDAAIIKKLAQRQILSIKIGKLKLKQGKKITDKTRETQLMQFYQTLSTRYHLQSEFVKRLFKMVIIHCRKVQK